MEMAKNTTGRWVPETMPASGWLKKELTGRPDCRGWSIRAEDNRQGGKGQLPERRKAIYVSRVNKSRKALWRIRQEIKGWVKRG